MKIDLSTLTFRDTAIKSFQNGWVLVEDIFNQSFFA